MSPAPYEIIIGLEVHVQLQTATKLFCGCRTTFGAPPNTQTCPICVGFPGTLPVMNRRAFELAVRTAIALNCQIAPFTKWDRKQYYYPDLPKGYQISQYDLPFSHDGWLEINDPKGRFEPRPIRILRVHLEEDAGKSMHDERAGTADSRIDLNRAGTPLMEIVTQPDLRSPAETKAFLTELKLLLTYLGVSDCNMQEGSLRVDGNVNLRVDEAGHEAFTPIVEVKNMNSFSSVERALAFEAERQFEVWQSTKQRKGQVPKHTRGWDDLRGLTYPQREKEESSDYRYFPDPDLVPVTVSELQVEEARSTLGTLPAALRGGLIDQFGVTPYDADVIVNKGRAVVDYYLTVAQGCGDGKQASNWLQQDVSRELNERQLSIDAFPVTAEMLARLLRKIKGGDLDTAQGRLVFQRMLETGEGVDAAIQSLGIQKVDESALIALCEQILREQPKLVADIRAGNLKAAGSLVGAAKKLNPNVNPGRVKELCLELIARS